MNAVMKIIYNRRAIRKYKPLPVDKKLIEELLDAGRMAPSALNIQPWKFYVVDDSTFIHAMDKDIRDVVRHAARMPGLAEYLGHENAIFHDAPVVIFITAPQQNEWAALDVGMCAQNMMLAARSMGLDTCPVGLGKFIEQTTLYTLLGIPETENILLSLTIGYGDENPVVHERKKDNVVYVRPPAYVKTEGASAR